MFAGPVCSFDDLFVCLTTFLSETILFKFRDPKVLEFQLSRFNLESSHKSESNRVYDHLRDTYFVVAQLTYVSNY